MPHAAASSTAFGARLREAREYVGFSLDESARFLGLTLARMEAIETGREPPAQDLADRLARLYRRPVDWLSEASEPRLPDRIAVLADSADLSEADRRELARFAEFVAGQRPDAART